jgi:hypothetical protein
MLENRLRPAGFLGRSASLRGGLRRKEEDFFFAHPALLPHPGSPGFRKRDRAIASRPARAGTGAWLC